MRQVAPSWLVLGLLTGPKEPLQRATGRIFMEGSAERAWQNIQLEALLALAHRDLCRECHANPLCTKPTLC